MGLEDDVDTDASPWGDGNPSEKAKKLAMSMYEILDVFADDGNENLVTLRYEIEGTHAGTFETIPPTDQHVHAKGIGIARFEDEEVVEFSLVFDNLGMLEDLGLIK